MNSDTANPKIVKHFPLISGNGSFNGGQWKPNIKVNFLFSTPQNT